MIVSDQNDINRACAAFAAAQPFLYLAGGILAQMALADILPKHDGISPPASAAATKCRIFLL
ncbi:hypothetical protein TH9_22480 [Thalassospira xiamenensis]|nr:hypothetical protein TH9_22480 [Thalassospira xiamenensis]